MGGGVGKHHSLAASENFSYYHKHLGRCYFQNESK